MSTIHDDAHGHDAESRQSPPPSERGEVHSLVEKAVGVPQKSRPGSMVTGADAPGGGAWNPLEQETPLSPEGEVDLGDDVLEDDDEEDD